jgi:hypothetical protein
MGESDAVFDDDVELAVEELHSEMEYSEHSSSSSPSEYYEDSDEMQLMDEESLQTSDIETV